MDYFVYGFAGVAAAFIGALPPGAVNLSVVYTTINQGAQYAVPIIITAAVGEIMLSYFALTCAFTVDHYIQQNIFLQYLIAVLLIGAGLFLFLKKTGLQRPKMPKRSAGFWKGLLLSIFNPPVLVFWLVAFTYLSSNAGLMLEMSTLQFLILFFLGVFIGKILALWVYLYLSKRIAAKAGTITRTLNQGISLLLILIGMVQVVKLSFF